MCVTDKRRRFARVSIIVCVISGKERKKRSVLDETCSPCSLPSPSNDRSSCRRMLEMYGQLSGWTERVAHTCQ